MDLGNFPYICESCENPIRFMKDQIRPTKSGSITAVVPSGENDTSRKRLSRLVVWKRPVNRAAIRAPGPCLALWVRRRVGKESHGFRNHPNRKQHRPGRLYLFRRDSNLARLSGKAAMANLRFQISNWEQTAHFSDQRSNAVVERSARSALRCEV